MRGSRGSAWAGREASHSGSDASTRIRDRALFLPSPSPASFLFPVPSSFLRCVAIGAERPCPANWGGLSMFASSAAFSFGGGPLRCLGAQRGIILRLTCKAAISNRACHGFGALALVPFVLPPPPSSSSSSSSASSSVPREPAQHSGVQPIGHAAGTTYVCF